MKLSEEIRSRPTQKGDWDSDIIADKVASLEDDFTSTMQSLAKRNQAYEQLEAKSAALRRLNSNALAELQAIADALLAEQSYVTQESE